MIGQILGEYDAIADGSYNLVNHHHQCPSMLDEDDYVYNNYTEMAINPGNTLFNIALFISIASIAGVPFVVRLWRCFFARWGKRHTDPSHDHHQMHDTETPANATTAKNMVGCRVMILQGIVREAGASMLCHQMEIASAFGNIEDDRKAQSKDAGEVGLDPPQTQSSGSIMGKDQHEICDEENFIAKPEYELESCMLEQQGTQEKADDISGGDSDRRPSSMSIYPLNYLWEIVKYDNETHQLVHLVVPFTLSSAANTASNLVELSIISQTLGTDAMIVYVMVQTIVGISSNFFGGFVEAITMLSSMAYRVENNKLAS
jgi:hypothetical protein